MIYRKLMLCLIVAMVGSVVYAQKGIGTNAPDNSAALDIESTNRGLLIPRVELKNKARSIIDGTNPTSSSVPDPTRKPRASESLLIYNKTAISASGISKGFYYWDSAKWVRLLTDDGGGDLSAAGGNGLKYISANKRLDVDLASNPGLELTGTSPDQKLKVKAGDGIELSGDGVEVKLAANKGLTFDGTSLAIDDSDGIELTNAGVKVKAVADEGIGVSNAGVRVNYDSNTMEMKGSAGSKTLGTKKSLAHLPDATNNDDVLLTANGTKTPAWGKIEPANIAANAVTTTKIADNNVTTGKIANSAVTEVKIANNAVTTNKINNSAVTTNKINNSAVTTNKINNSAVTTTKIADNNVTLAKIADATNNDDVLLTANGAKTPAWGKIERANIDNALPGNGLEFQGGKLKLGGTLDRATKITTTSANTLTIDAASAANVIIDNLPNGTPSDNKMLVADSDGKLKVVNRNNNINVLTANTTLTLEHDTVIVENTDTGSASKTITVTLPKAAATNKGKRYVIKRGVSGVSGIDAKWILKLKIAKGSSKQHFLDGVDLSTTGKSISNNYRAITVQSSGTTWYVIGSI